jgi:alkanesulfonate monooxygenase SsuD/methylene tetrahydromethanopterin reductase-like flavin-dependent oxidoreductase (luciferase family)
MKFGVLVPHYGEHASFGRIVEGAIEAEALGFASIWVRDHLVYRPHDFEDPNRTWLDPFIVLAAVGARTTRIGLGTATLIPYRHPIHDAQLLASLASLAAAQRLILGWGRGNDDSEFAAAGLAGNRRGERLEEHISVIRRLWTGQPVTVAGRYYSFNDVSIAAPGLAFPPRHWYGGSSALALKRVARAFDGLLASRIPADALQEQIRQLRTISESEGRPAFDIGLVGLVLPAGSVEEGLGNFTMDLIRKTTQRRFPQSAAASRPDAGVVITGTPDDIVSGLRRYADIGVEHFVLDFRARFDQWEKWMRVMANEVLPQFPSVAPIEHKLDRR